MRKLIFITLCLLVVLRLSSQCNVQISGSDVLCYGDCNGSLTAYPFNTVGPVSYMWSPGAQTTQTITGLCAGSYSCSITDSLGCTATGVWSVTSPPQLQAWISNILQPSCSSCCDGSTDANASGGTANYNYTWTGPNGYTAWFNATNMCTGIYTLCVTDANGCTACDTVNVSFPQAVSASSVSSNLIITPMASDGNFQLAASFEQAESGEIVVTNTMGQEVYRESFDNTITLQRQIDISREEAGMYFVTVVTDRLRISRKILKN